MMDGPFDAGEYQRWRREADRALAGADAQAAVGIYAALRRLSRHYIPARYPDAHPTGPPGDHYGETDWLDARTDLVSVLEFLDAIAP